MTVKEMLHKDLLSVRQGRLERGEDTDMIDGLLLKTEATHVSEDELMHDLAEAGLIHFAACIKNGVYIEMIKAHVKAEIYAERLEQDKAIEEAATSSTGLVDKAHFEGSKVDTLEVSQPMLVKLPVPGFDGFGFPRNVTSFEDLHDLH